MDEVQEVKKMDVEVIPNNVDVNVIKRVGKPKSEAWKQKHSEAMKLAHARRKEKIVQSSIINENPER